MAKRRNERRASNKFRDVHNVHFSAPVMAILLKLVLAPRSKFILLGILDRFCVSFCFLQHIDIGRISCFVWGDRLRGAVHSWAPQFLDQTVGTNTARFRLRDSTDTSANEQ
jgi:hypothetical protein